jgi:hypothetical protein
VLDEKIFDYELGTETKGEFYHTDVIREYAKDYPIAVVEQKLWWPVAYPEDVERVDKLLSAKLDSVEV